MLATHLQYIRPCLTQVLDLDHTLIHATNDPHVAARLADDPVMNARKNNRNKSTVANLIASQNVVEVARFSDSGINYFIKPRPCLTEFLEKASEKFELQVPSPR